MTKVQSLYFSVVRLIDQIIRLFWVAADLLYLRSVYFTPTKEKICLIALFIPWSFFAEL